MTEDEARNVLKQIFTAFPDYQAWLKKSDEPQETLTVWSRMLTSVRLETANRVVDMLLDGTRNMPEAYERGQLPIILKSYAARIEQDDASARLAEESRIGRRRARSDRPQYKLPLAKGFVMMRQLGHDLRDGKITRDQHDAEKRRVLAMAMEVEEVVA